MNKSGFGRNRVAGLSLGLGWRGFECGVGARRVGDMCKGRSARIIIGRGSQFLGLVLFLVGF